MDTAVNTTDASDAQNYTLIPSCVTADYYLFACLNESRFLGCCTDENACANGCINPTALGNMLMYLKQPGNISSFDESLIPSQTCLQDGQNSGGVWSNCPEKASDLNFVGCCTSDPCYDGCPEGNLVPTFLAQTGASSVPFFWGMNSTLGQKPPPSDWEQYPVSFDLSSGTYKRLPKVSSNVSSASTSESASSPTARATAFATGSKTGSTSTVPQSMNASVIAGIAVGSVAGFVLLAALLTFFLKRRLAHTRKNENGMRAPESGGKIDTNDATVPSTKTVDAPPESGVASEYTTPFNKPSQCTTQAYRPVQLLWRRVKPQP